jgi:hypothetical protein
MAIRLLIALTALSIAVEAGSSPIVPQFYEIKASLSNGRTMEGYSYGVSWMGGPLAQERRVNTVVLHVDHEILLATFEFLGDHSPVVYEVGTRDREGRPRTLSLASGYEVFHRDIDFFWMKDVHEYPLSELLRIDTVRFLGPGLPVSDPTKYTALREPFLSVDDCGLGCEAKMHSKDPLVTRKMLKNLWEEYFKCSERSAIKQKERDRIREAYQLEWLTDPFCHD